MNQSNAHFLAQQSDLQAPRRTAIRAPLKNGSRREDVFSRQTAWQVTGAATLPGHPGKLPQDQACSLTFTVRRPKFQDELQLAVNQRNAGAVPVEGRRRPGATIFKLTWRLPVKPSLAREADQRTGVA